MYIVTSRYRPLSRIIDAVANQDPIKSPLSDYRKHANGISTAIKIADIKDNGGWKESRK